MNIIDEIRQRADSQPGHPALISASKRGAAERIVTYAELVARMDECAQQLLEAGCHRCERVGLVAAQGAGFIEVALGILAAGLCFVPISDDYDGPALDGFVERTRLHWLLRESAGFRPRRFPEAGAVDEEGDEAFRALDPAYIRFTSGTTDERKGVIIGHKSILDRLANANRALAIGPKDRIMWMLPMAHHFVVSILLYLRYGATILLPSSYLSRPVLEMANNHSATVFYASPYHYDLLAKDATDLGLPNVRLAVSTASGLTVDIAERFLERMDIPLSQALGIIEVGLPAINLKHARDKPLSLGQVLPDYQVWLRGDNGRPVTGVGPQTGSGEVCIRGSGLFDAYMSPWLPASRITEPDGFRTGDQGYFDADGDLFLHGRRHNRINMAGMKFFAEEVEAIVNTHPGIRESRVYGKPHAHLGEIPLAQVVADDPEKPPDPRELFRYCKQRMAAHKVPFDFEFVTALARTSTGKIKRW